MIAQFLLPKNIPRLFFMTSSELKILKYEKRALSSDGAKTSDVK